MPIKVKCGSCSAAFSAKDTLAGKNVKCPKCGSGIRVPAASAPANPTPARTGATQTARGGFAGTVSGNLGDPLADLLDEVGVKAVATGAVCPSCEAPVSQGAKICINCGLNFETGTFLQTLAYEDGADDTAGMSETDKMLWKAEKEIDDMPITGDGQDFGDGASAYVVAGAVAIVGITLAATGLLITMGLQQMADSSGSAIVAVAASALFFLIGHVWMIIMAFTQEPKYGVMCTFIPLFTLVFACMNRVWFAVFMMVVGLMVGSAAGAFIYYQ
ncbi:MAG: hypothetical protein Q8M16_14490 [Pirellulaceae bacterium]|nr:hypothetical protein [Pirellulaceae bacterium]